MLSCSRCSLKIRPRFVGLRPVPAFQIARTHHIGAAVSTNNRRSTHGWVHSPMQTLRQQRCFNAWHNCLVFHPIDVNSGVAMVRA